MRYLSFSLICFLIVVPSVLKAQSDPEGNHCAFQKSPYKISMDSGKVVFTNKCFSCHQANGLGIEGISPPLNEKLVKGDKTKLIEIFINGHNTEE
ncbi:MAG TPA: cytochrome c [Puia sp.]